MEADIVRLFQNVKVDYPGFQFDLKQEQIECLASLMRGNHVFALLPSGYGKILIYTIFPLLMEQVRSLTILILIQESAFWESLNQKEESRGKSITICECILFFLYPNLFINDDMDHTCKNSNLGPAKNLISLRVIECSLCNV